MPKKQPIDARMDVASELETHLNDLHGPMMGGHSLYKALGYRSADSFRRALMRKAVPVRVFTVKNRKGRHALTKDVARWIADQYEKGDGAVSPDASSEELNEE